MTDNPTQNFKSTETLTKALLSERLNKKLGDSRNKSEQIVEMFFEEISQCLETGEEVKISGLGNYKLHDKKSRPGRNPKTGEGKEISARRVCTFKAGGKLKERIEKLDPATLDIKEEV